MGTAPSVSGRLGAGARGTSAASSRRPSSPAWTRWPRRRARRRRAWGQADLEARRAGQTHAVITALEAEGTEPTWTGAQRPVVRRPVGSSPRHLPSRPDAAYRARGGPIGTGGVAGACGHRVKDRLAPSERRGRNAGAPAVLDLRAVRLNGPGERSGPGHRQPPHHRLSGPSALGPERAEGRLLERAA
jgi:hypothetical protein